jgi:putative transposase
MIHFKSIIAFLREWYFVLTHALKDSLKSRTALEMEILALRSQLSIFQQQIINHKLPKPRPTPVFRQLWVFISKLWSDWKSALFIVKPETVIGWHHTAFRFYGLENQSIVAGQPYPIRQLP